MVTWEVDVKHASPTIEASFVFHEPRVAIMGASGSGKTSLARCLMGLSHAHSARVVVGGEVLEDSSLRVRMTPEARGLGYVPQNDLLMPHLSVLENLTLSPRSTSEAAIVRVNHVIEALELGPLTDRKPRALSGGERRRVAMGRALLAATRGLILDEPLTGLDERFRLEVLRYLQRLLHEFPRPTLLITHRADEAAALATQGALMDGGRVVEIGSIPQVLHRLPGATDDTISIMDGVIVEDASTTECDTTTILIGRTTWIATSTSPQKKDARVRIFLDADDVILASTRPSGVSARNVLQVRVMGLDLIGGAAMLVLSPDDPACVFRARITAQSAARFALKCGDEVYALIKSHALRIH